MELEESKGALLRRSSHYKNQLEDEAKLLSERTQKTLTNALVIGGALALSYFLVRQLSRPEKKRTKTKHRKVKLVAEPEEHAEMDDLEEESSFSRVITEISSTLTGQATAFLLSLAKEKLIEYLQSKNEKKLPNE